MVFESSSAAAKTQLGGQTDELSAGLRSTITLLLLIHLFIVALVLSGNYATSSLQARLLRFFSPYTQPLNLDLNYTPFQLTHATADDVDHRIEILPQGPESSPTNDSAGEENWVAMPTPGNRGGERSKRYQRLASALAYFAVREDSQTTGLLAKSLAAHSLHQDKVTPQQIRCRKHLLQSMESIEGGTEQQRDPNDASYFQEAYRANTICLDDGTVEIIKAAGRGEVAGPDAPAKTE